jgi:hypothetical protein
MIPGDLPGLVDPIHTRPRAVEDRRAMHIIAHQCRIFSCGWQIEAAF